MASDWANKEFTTIHPWSGEEGYLGYHLHSNTLASDLQRMEADGWEMWIKDSKTQYAFLYKKVSQ